MMSTVLYSGKPINVCIEASWDVIHEHNLDTWEGEHFDWVKNCISIERDANGTTFTTCRSIEAWRAGEPNAGRYTLTIENKNLEKIHFPDNKSDKE